jgi:1-acyl-sn-glycerol-3-phosphate acyltransferase
VRQLTAVASGILRDAAAAGASRSAPARQARPWLATGPSVDGDQAAEPWAGPRAAGVAPGAAATAQGLRQLVGNVLRLAEDHLGDGEPVDEFGFDPEFNARYLLPVARFFYQRWFRVSIRGLAHVPVQGPALVVANHSGTLPMDAVMLQTGLHDVHPAQRNLRVLGADLVYEVPLLSALARRGGHIPAAPANADALLRAGELVGVFPEGFKGIGKPFAERYHLQRFGRGGFAATAIRAGVPLIPCAIIGAEEIYPMLGNARQIAGLLRLPYFPITPLFPWLGPVGMVPLPSRWIIEFCPPVATNGYEPGDEADPGAVADLSGRIRGAIQRKLDDLLDERGPAFG